MNAAEDWDKPRPGEKVYRVVATLPWARVGAVVFLTDRQADEYGPLVEPVDDDG